MRSADDSAPSLIALIPARSGSKRISNKNILRLGDHPLIAYTIAAARSSGVFSTVAVATDSARYAEIAHHYGAEVPVLRPASISADTSPDIEWVRFILRHLEETGCRFDAFSILRPTSPFRQPETIRRAHACFLADASADSLRAIERCRQHPGTMWIVRGPHMTPLIPLSPPGRPWHSEQYAALPEVYVQNASLEIAWTRVVEEQNTIAGTVVMPFFTEGTEGLDINDEWDLWRAERLLRAGSARLPDVSEPPWAG